MAYNGAVIGAQVFLKTVMSATTIPPISPPHVHTIGLTLPAAIMFHVMDELKTRSNSNIPVLLTVPDTVISFVPDCLSNLWKVSALSVGLPVLIFCIKKIIVPLSYNVIYNAFNLNFLIIFCTNL